MQNIYFDEHGKAKFIFRESDHVYVLHEINNKLQLSDVDFVLENAENRLFIEYKNANVGQDNEERFKERLYNGKLQNKLARKFWDSLFIMQNINHNEMVNVYEVIIEADIIDKAVRKRLKKKLSDIMLMDMSSYGVKGKLVQSISIFDVEGWKKHHPEYELELKII